MLRSRFARRYFLTLRRAGTAQGSRSRFSVRVGLRVEFLILGPLEVRSEGKPVVLAGRRQRALLSLLLLRANEAVSVDALVEGLWGETPPRTASHALQVFVSDLRKALRGAGEDRIATQSPGYLIRVEPDELDLHRFERLATEGRNALARDDPAAASAVLAEALTLWRGDPLADLAYEAFAQEPIARLEEQRLSALEDRIAADLQLGKHAELVGELEALTAKHPYREGLRHHLMLALYRAGRQSEALAVYQETRRLLVDELGIDPKPELQELERAILVQDPALEPEPLRDADHRSEEKPRTNLPTPPTTLIGRERELEETQAELARPEVRLLTLVGPGGTGKTRLALQLGAELTETFRNGVYFVALAPIEDPRLVLPAVAQALGVREIPGETLADTLTLFLEKRELLLLVDNFEQVLEAGPALADLLRNAPQVKALVTSRAPLRLAGEHEYAVPPLGLPEPEVQWQPDELARHEAVRLLVERARSIKGGFAITSENASTVAKICRRLDGLPLAIELAAARLRILSPEELLARLDERLTLLTGGVRDADERQKTLRGTIDWSYRLLAPDQQALFARLAVFAGGCTLEAAEPVCGDDVKSTVLDGLTQLVEQSLLRQRPGSEGQPRFEMLETIREYARERLLARDDAGEVRRRHGEHYLDFAVATATAAWKQPRLYDRLEDERDNVRAMLEWAVAEGGRGQALLMIKYLYQYWVVRGHIAEGTRWAERLLSVEGHGEARDEAFAHQGAGELARSAGDLRRAVELKEAGLEHARGTDPSLQANVARDLVFPLLALGDARRAEQLANEALELRTSLGTTSGIAHALVGVAAVHWHHGRRHAAIELLEEALARWQEADDLLQVSGTEEELANCLRQIGDLERAEVRLRSALTTSIRLGDVSNSLWCLRGFGSLAADEGSPERAARMWGALEALSRQTGFSFAEHPSDYQEKVDQVRQALGDDEFARLWSEGAAMEYDDATGYALESG
jgi:predicted ATPase/DNA-binding SARP family transcriptional activator